MENFPPILILSHKTWKISPEFSMFNPYQLLLQKSRKKQKNMKTIYVYIFKRYKIYHYSVIIPRTIHGKFSVTFSIYCYIKQYNMENPSWFFHLLHETDSNGYTAQVLSDTYLPGIWPTYSETTVRCVGDGDRISCQQTTHQSWNPALAWSEQEMGMVPHKHPGITAGSGCRNQGSQAIIEILLISFIRKYVSAFNPPYHNMVYYAGGIQSRLSCHNNRLNIRCAFLDFEQNGFQLS